MESTGSFTIEKTSVVVGILAGLTGIVSFAMDLMPGAVTLVVSGVMTVALCVLIAGVLFRGRLWRRDVPPTKRAVALASLGVALGFTALLGLRGYKLVTPPAPKPTPEDKVEVWGYGRQGGLTLPSQALGGRGVSVRYLFVSGDYLQALFQQKLVYGPGEMEAPDRDKRLLTQMLDQNEMTALVNEPFRFGRSVWQTAIAQQAGVGALKERFTAVQARPKFDSRWHRFKKNDFEDIMWFEADNQTLLKSGWLDLDPLSRRLAEANPGLKMPLAKAGVVRVRAVTACGTEGGPSGPQEAAFIVPRKAKLLALEIENTGDRTVRDITLQLRAAQPNESELYRLRSWADLKRWVERQPERPWVVHDALAPGHFLVVPLSLAIGEFDEQAEYEPTTEGAANYFGPAALVSRVQYKTGLLPRKLAVREFDENRLQFSNGQVMIGSCPALLTRSTQRSPWRRERLVLVGADGPQKARWEAAELHRFDGSVALAEYEPETTHLDSAYVIAEDERGREVRLSTRLGALRRHDGRSVEIRRGEQLEIAFDGWRKGLRRPRLVVDGYYVPDK